jgi:peptidoglycan/LPS O-acetylase OafA/YrhL
MASLSTAIVYQNDRAMARPAAAIEPGRHIPALDGLRGLAVLLVLVFHIFQAEPAPAHRFLGLAYEATLLGQTGVELFFVLSGFLITGILYDAKSSRHYFRNFYGRRALRIFPIYYAVSIVVLVVVPRIVGFRTTGLSWLSLCTYSANFALAAGSDGGTLGHFWSLAIEEQFYLAWPIAVYFLDRSALIRVCWGSLLAAAAFRGVEEWLGYSSWLLTPGRIDTLLLGALLALAARSPQGLRGWSRGALIAALVSLAIGMLLRLAMGGSGSIWLPIFKYPMIGLFYCAVLVVGVTASSRSCAGCILHFGPLRNLGKYSYGIYVYHPLLVPIAAWMVREIVAATGGAGAQPGVEMLARLGLISGGSYATAWLSWHLMEKHFLSLKRCFEYDSPPSQ